MPSRLAALRGRDMSRSGAGRPDRSSSGFAMKVKTKIWLGVGAFVLAGSGATKTSANPRLAAETPSGVSGLPGRSPDTATSPAASRGVVMSQLVAPHAGHDAGEGG